MDERLKEKLELLGEPDLPESLSAEELFRRIDSGQLQLPEETETEAAPSGKVIPWAKVLRRGLPIAAGLALVVFIAQGGIWRMGSSGGANLSAKAAAPQQSAAADQAASAPAFGDESASTEGYSFYNGTEAPQNILAEEEGGQEQETAGDFDDVAEDTSADTDKEVPRQYSGESDKGKPVGFADGEEELQDNPDMGPADYDREKNNLNSQMETELIEETFRQLHAQDPALTGLTPILHAYGPVSALTPGETEIPLHAFFRYENDAGETVAFRVIKCRVNQREDRSWSLDFLSFEEWDGETSPY